MSRKEDDAVALVRVYCGLASADLNTTPPGSVTWLTVAVVDDAGRLLDICDISDDASGFAELGALLADRSNGLESVAIAADSDDHIVTQLLTAAGRYLAYTDEDSAEDYAERFGDDETTDEVQSSPAERRAIGLARALQAGVLSAVAQATPRDLLGLKPVLAAHAAVTTGRQGTAATLREVLRELYPAALRAFPDPAEPIPLAILDALPEPGPLGSNPNGRGRDAQAIAELTEAGVAEAAVIAEAVTALRVAIAETPRRTGMNRSITSAVAETVRQSVAAVRACDAAAAALVSVLAARMPSAGAPVLAGSATRARSAAAPTPEPAAALRAVIAEEPARPAASRRPRSQPAAVRPRSAPPVARPQSAPPATAPAEPVTHSMPPAAAAASGSHRAGQPTMPQPAQRQPGSRRSAAAQHPAAQPAVVEQPPAAAHAPVPVQTPAATPVPVQNPAPAPIPVQAPPAPIPVPSPATVPMPVHPAAHSPMHPGTHSPMPPAVRAQPVAAVPPPGLTPAYPTTPQPAAPSPQRTPPAADPRVAPAAGLTTRPLASGSVPASTAPTPAMRPPAPADPSASAPAGPPPTSGLPAQPYYGNGSGDLGRYAGARPDFATGSRPAADVPPPGSRASWPLLGEATRDSAEAHRTPEPRGYPATAEPRGYPATAEPRAYPAGAEPPAYPGAAPEGRMETLRIDPTGALDASGTDLPRQREGRVMPPWQADDLPAEPPGLRLVEPAPLADPALSPEQPPQYRDDFDGKLRFEPRALRLVEANRNANGVANPGGGNGSERLPRRTPVSKPTAAEPEPLANDESDGDLLIFAEARSVWFTDHFGEDDVKLEWSTESDAGWRAAEQAAEPAVGAETGSGLPRRVPQQNLVPGSPMAAPERPLRIVRDAAAIAAHTTGYFRGWRRGQEVGGYRVGGRPGRESAGWDFSRDQDSDRDYEYRSARR